MYVVICEPFFFLLLYTARWVLVCVLVRWALLLSTFEGSRPFLNSVVLGVILVTGHYFDLQITRGSQKSLGPTKLFSRPTHKAWKFRYESSTSPRFIHEYHKDMRGVVGCYVYRVGVCWMEEKPHTGYYIYIEIEICSVVFLKFKNEWDYLASAVTQKKS